MFGGSIISRERKYLTWFVGRNIMKLIILIMTNKIIPKKKTQIEKILAKQREEVVKRITEWREK